MIPCADIVCFEAGSSEQSPWCSPRVEIGSDMESLERLAKDQVIDLIVKGNVVTIKGKDRVGLVILPSGRRLIIRTKIPSVTILEWLMYLGELPELRTWLQESGVGLGDDFHISIGKLFLRELDSVTRLHLRKDYVAKTSEESLLRGRLLVTRLACRLHRLPRLPLAHRRRTINTPYNSVLALALDKLRALYSDFSPEDRRAMVSLRDQWASISREVADPVNAVTEAQWACPPGYRNAVQLARLILLGLSLQPKTSMGGQAFTLSLALIWERSVRKMLFDLNEHTGWTSASENNRTRRWDDSYGAEDPSRWLTADVVLEQDSERWVLDAKYKRAFGDENRADRFQMCAYAVAFDAERATLVYPSASGGVPAIRTLLRTTVGAKVVLIDSIDLPMESGPHACINALIRVCQVAVKSRLAEATLPNYR